MKKSENYSDKQVRESFERTMTALFRIPKDTREKAATTRA